MIVRYESDGTVVMITQNDHAKLAGHFAAHWGNSHFQRPRPWGPVVRAAHYHDSGWFRYETDPRFLDGKTPNYQQVSTDATQLAAYQTAIDMLTGVDAYTGMLVSKHRTGLWQSRYAVMKEPPPGPPRQVSPEVQRFIARNEAQQKMIEAGLDPHAVAVNYNMLQVWDVLSLFICSYERFTERTIAPVPTDYQRGEGVCMRLAPASPSRIVVDPYPFDQPALDIGVVHRRLPRNTFNDVEEFQAAYFAAAPQIANFTLVGV